VRARIAIAAAMMLAGALGPSPASAQVPPLVEQLPVTVVMVRVAGPWSTGTAKGISRIVAIADGTRMRLFVQWIADTARGPQMVDTREVSEVAAQGLIFGDVRVDASENEAEVFLDTLPGADGARDTYVLVAETPGQIRFGRAGN
jgi:hypothetical protein